jgi:hypothetical protein
MIPSRQIAALLALLLIVAGAPAGWADEKAKEEPSPARLPRPQCDDYVPGRRSCAG